MTFDAECHEICFVGRKTNVMTLMSWDLEWDGGQGKRVNLPISVVADHIPWWRHQMETFSALLALCAGNSPVPVNSPHKGQWRGALMFSLMWAWINDWVNNREAGDLRRYRGHYDVSVMLIHRTRGCFVHLESYICHLTGYCGKAAPSVLKAGYNYHEIRIYATRLFTNMYVYHLGFCIANPTWFYGFPYC